MHDSSAIYTIHIASEYKDFAQALIATLSIMLMLHVLLSGQKSTGLIGSMFNSPFSDTLAKVIVSIAFYYLVVKKILIIK
jgi:hypothetical protein